MRRIQVLLDDEIRRAVRAMALQQHRSMAAVMRELLREGLGLPKAEAEDRVRDVYRPS
jgi:plasmid stability protein